MVELAAAADRHGGGFEPLAHGGAIVTFAGSPAATDLVGRAARFALEARRLCDGGVALASGRGATGNLSVGDAIERAASLLRRAAHGDRDRPVAVDEVSAALLGPRFELDGAGALRAERRDDGVRTILGRPTPTVGRERELNLLVQLCRDSADEPAAAAMVVIGEAGVGKSRLRHELVERLGRAAQVWSGRGDPVRAGSPFSLLGSALRRRLGVDDVSTPAARVAAIRRVAIAVDDLGLPEPERVTTFLAELIGAPQPGPASTQLAAARRQPRLMNDQLRRAFLELCAAELGRGPIVWTFDDLHWGDAPSIELVDEALRAFADRPLAAIGFARPEVEGLFPRLWAQRGASQLRLGPLAKKAAVRLAEGVLGAGARAGDDRGGRRARRRQRVLPRGAVARRGRRRGRATARDRGGDGPGAARGAGGAGPAGAARRVGARQRGSRSRRWPRSSAPSCRSASSISCWPIWWRASCSSPRTSIAASCRSATTRSARRRTACCSTAIASWRTASPGCGSRRSTSATRLTVAQHLEAGGEEARAALWYRYAAEHALEAGDPHAVIDRAARGLECGAVEHERGALLLLACIAHDWLGETEATERCALGALDAAREGSAVWLRAAAELAVVAGRLGNHHLLVGVARDLARARAGEARRERVVALAIVASELLLVGHIDQARRLLERVEELRDAWSTDGVAGAWRLRAQRHRRAGRRRQRRGADADAGVDRR
jgi:hypothetical protein